MALRIAIYGYDTDIGRLILEVLEERRFPVSELYPLSPLPGEYDAVTLGGRNYLIEYVDDFDFAKADLAFFITTPDETARLQQKVRQSGCIVIDNSRLYSGSAISMNVVPSSVTGARGGTATYTVKEIHEWYGSYPETSASVSITVRSGVVSVYDSSGNKHTGLVTAYDSEGKSHYVLITAYDSSGKAHSVV